MSQVNDQFDFNDRYGIKPARTWIKYAITFAVIGGAWLLWAGLNKANPVFRYDLISFSTQDSRNPEIRYFVDRQDKSQAITCTLTARDIDKNVVGQIDDTIPAGNSYIERTIAIPTRADAVNAGIASCRALP